MPGFDIVPRVGAALFVLLVSVVPLAAGTEDRAREIDAFMRRLHDCDIFDGSILVAEGDRVIYKGGFGFADRTWGIPNSPDTKFRIGSITKTFTATLIMQLIEEGKLSLDGPAIEYLPDYPAENGGRVKIRHLLNHKSGIPNFNRDIPGFWGDGRSTAYKAHKPEEFIGKFAGLDLKFEPGERFEYCNSGFYLLGVIIEKVTGMPYAEVLRERILDPAGMADTGYEPDAGVIVPRAALGYYRTLDGYENARYIHPTVFYSAGALYSTVEDLFRWDRILRGEKILSGASKDQMFAAHYRNPSRSSGYGFGWNVATLEIDASLDSVDWVGHAGDNPGFFGLIARFPEEERTLVFLCNSNSLGVQNMFTLVTPILRILHDRPFDMPRKSVARTIYPTLRGEGVVAAIRNYHDLKATSSDVYLFDEGELNTLGYQLIGMGMIDEAIELFKLNVAEYPDASNPYDSLGEAYMIGGFTGPAIENYEKSLELNPDNSNAVEMLKKLKERQSVAG